MAALARGQPADLGDALVSAVGYHVGATELAPEIGAGGVAAHQQDPLGAESPGRKHGGQADRAVADHGDRGALAHAGLDRRVVPGREHVGEGEQRSEHGLVLGGRQRDQSAVRLGTRTASP